MTIFQEIIGLLICLECEQQGGLHSIKGKGLSSCLFIKCTSCSFTIERYTSKTVKNKNIKSGSRAVKINIMSVYGMRRYGVGHKGLQTFCGVLNIPPPMAGNTYDVLSEIICNVAMKVAKASMIHAASELKKSERSDVGVSIDGSCQRRGFSSLNGVITVISINSGNSLDCQILSRHCKACVIHAPK